ncbi:hypothetical protein HYT57_00030 [Candidatus Woesearchaeota archaeon]|nr:hypothetical protein [Candidatus Woesearchaeota archaeon]
MSEIIYLDPVPAHISQVDLERLFEREERFQGTLAELLLNNPATVVYHVDPETTYSHGDAKYVEQLILGANYHNSVDGGDHKIIVQHIPERKGPWVFFIPPPGSNEKVFHLQDLNLLTGVAKFQEMVHDSVAKIKRFYLHRGNSLQIFEDFKARVFSFVDKAMPEERYEELEGLYSQQRVLNITRL